MFRILIHLCNNSAQPLFKHHWMSGIYLCCFAFPVLQIRYMQVSDVAIMTLPTLKTSFISFI